MSELDRKQAERAQTNGRYPLAHEAPAMGGRTVYFGVSKDWRDSDSLVVIISTPGRDVRARLREDEALRLRDYLNAQYPITENADVQHPQEPQEGGERA